MRSPRRFLLKSAVAALFLIHASGLAGAELARVETLTIRRSSGDSVRFTVEMATTPQEREIGLMNRKTMAMERGMLFDFGTPQPVYMWMHNTYLALDMLFIDDKGVVRHIEHDAAPLSEAIIDSLSPVRFVLELNAGVARRQALQENDVVSSPTIDKARAASSN